MKELSIEEKAKRYDEALERAKEMIKAMTNIGGVAKVDDIQHIFQLNESEDEKIRKEMITYLSTVEDKELIPYESWITWLEKQGEKGTNGNEREIPNSAWSEEDEYCHNIVLYALNNECVGKTDKENAINWLNFLKGRVQLQSKQEWSEDDERIYKSITYSFAHNYPLTVQQQEFVKSLKNRAQSQNRWKESLATADLENSLCDMQDGFSDTSYEYRILGEAIEFIRCTESKSQWKPSDEQMDALTDALSLAKNCGEERVFDLRTLYEQLKKLREE